VHGSFGAWYRDTIVVATQFPRMPFFDTMNYGSHAAGALGSIAASGLGGLVNGAFWIVLTVLAAVTGAIVLRHLSTTGDAPRALAVLAVFYAMVAVHYQIPIYLTYTSGLSLVALIVLAGGTRAMAFASIAMAAIALYFHAGQPLSRGLGGMTDGERTEVVPAARLPRVGLRVEPADIELYDEVITLIKREAPPGATILAIPSHAELYFLAERRNPFGFFNSAFGVRTPLELAAVMTTLDREPPALVIYNSTDKYNTAESRQIMQRVMSTYEALPPVGQFQLYRLPREAVAAGPRPQSSRE
jgi:hypothetical protein